MNTRLLIVCGLFVAVALCADSTIVDTTKIGTVERRVDSMSVHQDDMKERLLAILERVVKRAEAAEIDSIQPDSVDTTVDTDTLNAQRDSTDG